MSNSQKPIILPSQVEAISFIANTFDQGELVGGEVWIEVHRAWKYHAPNLPMSRDGRQRWVLDTGELFDTTLDESENIPEKALSKYRAQLNIKDKDMPNDNRYDNPVDGKSYMTDGQWKTYQPSNSQQPQQEKVLLNNVRLLTDQDTFAANFSTDQLSNFIKEVTATVKKAVGNVTANFQLMLQFELSSGQPFKLEMANQGEEVSNDELQRIYDAVKVLEAPSPKSQSISFQALFTINGTGVL